MNILKTAILLLFLLTNAAGCSIAPTSLACGTDDSKSYVTLENLKDNSPQTIQQYRYLCSFAYEGDQ
jgi:P pilus assembly chaperone PapD